MIIINKPRVELMENGAKLISNIEIDEKDNEVWYSVDKEYAEYLCYEKADAFLLAVLPYAMASGQDIVVKDSVISENIFWRLTNEFIPTMAKYSKMYKRIKVNSEITDLRFDSKAVGTGFSAGIDSFYTILRNLNQSTVNHNITHVTFFNVGACGYGSNEYGKNAEKVFYERTALFEKDVEKLGLKFVKVNSNLPNFVPMWFNWIHSYRSMSAVLALQKLFRYYYYSSEGPLEFFSLDYDDSGFYDLLNTDCFSTESTRFYSIGLWEARIEKADYISEYPITYNVLNVCNSHATNCRSCDKCIRSMGEFYALKKLENYKAVFDVDYYKSHQVYYCKRLIEKCFDGSVEAKYNKEILTTMRKNGINVPTISYIYAVPKIIFNIGYKYARKSKLLTRLHHERISAKTGLYFGDVEKQSKSGGGK